MRFFRVPGWGWVAVLSGLFVCSPIHGQAPIPPQALVSGKAEGVSLPSDLSGATSNSSARLDTDWSKIPNLEPAPPLCYQYYLPSRRGFYSLKEILKWDVREKPPVFPYAPFALTPTSTFNYDFRYLDDPSNTQKDFFDPVKRMHLGDSLLLTAGAEIRWRHMREVDSQLTGRDNTYELMRTRASIDVWYQDRVRVFGEFIDARSFYQDLPPSIFDQDHADILNLFMDVKLLDVFGTPADVRLGRQELLYGSQRLISTQDWWNTRQTFQGVKAFWHGEHLSLDAFWVQPVVPSADRFNSVDDRQNFAGIWATVRPKKGHWLDLYYLYLDNTNPVIGRDNLTGGNRVNTLGSRYYGEFGDFLLDLEGMYQFGERVDQNISAGALTAGLGYRFSGLPMNPQLWVYYDWASGNHNPGAGGTYGTFSQLFAYGHHYFGYLDLVGRQNISDLSVQYVFNPFNWMTMGFQHHIFRLDSARDGLYNAAGVQIRRDPTGLAGTEIGNEVDVSANIHLTSHQDLYLGWSKLYSGQFIKQTGSPRSPELFYVMYGYKW